jgi:hypothetical protein
MHDVDPIGSIGHVTPPGAWIGAKSDEDPEEAEGEYEHALDNEPIKTYKAGETFYEPSGSVHRVAHNPSAKTETRLLAVILHPRDAKGVTVPEAKK